MKKLLGILVLGLLFISIDLSNPIKVEAAEGFTLSELLENKREVEKRKMERMGFFERQKYKYEKHKRSKNRLKARCSQEAASASTSYAAKKIYDACMD